MITTMADTGSSREIVSASPETSGGAFGGCFAGVAQYLL